MQFSYQTYDYIHDENSYRIALLRNKSGGLVVGMYGTRLGGSGFRSTSHYFLCVKQALLKKYLPNC